MSPGTDERPPIPPIPAWPDDLPRLRPDPHADGAFLLPGESAAVHATVGRGPARIFLDSRTVVSAIGLDRSAETKRIEISDGASLRRIDLGDAVLHEHLLAFRRLPAAVLQWHVAPSSPGSGPGRVSLHLDVPSHGEPVEGEDGALTVHVSDGQPVRFRALGGRLGVGRTGRGAGTDAAAVLRIEVEAGTVATLLIVDATRVRTVKAAEVRLGDLQGELGAWSSWARRADEEGLALQVGDPPLEAAWARAGRRLLSGGVTVGRSSAWTGLGLLARGDRAAAVTVAEQSRRRLARSWNAGAPGAGASGADAPDAPDAPGRALDLHLLSRVALWTGAAGPLRELSPRIVERAADPAATDPRSRRALRAALLGAADALEAPGEPHLPAGIRKAAAALEVPEGERASLLTAVLEDGLVVPDGLGFPDGSGVPDGVGAPDGSVDRTQPVDRPGPVGPGRLARLAAARSGLLAWVRWVAGDPGAAVGPWRHAVEGAAGAEGGHPGSADPDVAAVAVAALLFGLLGARAEAAFGRLRLAPRIPTGWNDVSIRGIRVGDSRLDFSCQTRGDRRTFRLVPTSGAVPLNLVFEPLLPSGGIREVLVDGRDADLERWGRHGWTGVRLQLPLDRKREIIVETEGWRDDDGG